MQHEKEDGEGWWRNPPDPIQGEMGPDHQERKIRQAKYYDPKLICSHSANLSAPKDKDISHKSICPEQMEGSTANMK